MNVAEPAHRGESSPLRRESPLQVHAPASGLLLGEISRISLGDVPSLVARTRQAGRVWGKRPVPERALGLLQFARTVTDRTEELVELISQECGKPRHEALIEVALGVDLLRYYAEVAANVLAEERVSLRLFRHRTSTLTYFPRGVIGISSASSFPFSIPLASIAAALAAGNGAVLKPSDRAPLVGLKIRELFDASGFPAELLQVVVGAGDATEALLDAGIDFLVFNGTVADGRRVAALAGEHLVPCVLGLGGKAPLLACADCDIEETARAAVYGGFMNSGQSCISVERVYAHREIYETLCARIVARTEELKIGDPKQGYPDVGPMICASQMGHLRSLVADARQKGAKVACGGTEAGDRGQYFSPTVLLDCNPSMRVMNEETFGPILPIQPFDEEEEAVRLANASPLGLNAYVFTKDRAKGARLARELDAGSIVLNDVLSNYALSEVPFGGIKRSGYGRVHGPQFLRDLSHQKHINEPKVALLKMNLHQFPYTARRLSWMTRLFRALFATH